MALSPTEDTKLGAQALAYVIELYRELTVENGAPTLGTQNQAVDFIRADPELRRAVSAWAEAADIDEATRRRGGACRSTRFTIRFAAFSNAPWLRQSSTRLARVRHKQLDERSLVIMGQMGGGVYPSALARCRRRFRRNGDLLREYLPQVASNGRTTKLISGAPSISDGRPDDDPPRRSRV